MINLGVLGDWISGRPKWQQEALQILAKKGTFSEEDKTKLYELCKGNEVSSTDSIANTEPPAANSFSSTPIQIKIHELSGLRGVGSISTDKALTFGRDGLTVIFGRNGTGKSSYVRFLKSVSGNRFAVPLVGNVFSSEVVPKQARVQFSVNGELQAVDWTELTGKIESLECIAIYDSHCANIYVSNENEVTFEPYALKILSDLASVCSEFDAKLMAEAKRLITELPAVPPEHKDHLLLQWLSKLSNATEDEEIERLCSWSEDDEANLRSITERLSEVNPAEKSKHLKLEAQHLGVLKKMMEDHLALYSDEACFGLLIDRKVLEQKRGAADDFAKTCFENAPLEGIGTETWKAMWLAAKKYSETLAYREKPFPPVSKGDLCLLCLRPHDDISRTQFRSFDDFVIGKLESEATSSERQYNESLSKFKVSSEAEVEQKLKDASLDKLPEAFEVRDFFAELRKRHKTLLEAGENDEVSSLPASTIVEKFSCRIVDLETRGANLEADSQKDMREGLLAEQKTLLVKSWLHKHLDHCKQEVKRLSLVAKLEQARKTTATGPISTKKSALSETLLTEAFATRFQTELNSLGGGHIKVALLKTRTDKSKVFHQIKLKGIHQKITSQILSEGEHRVVSIAAFLADLLGQERIGTFIFDDPISSLDQTYENATAKRLLGLAEDRQVIVFTHRLSLAYLLDEKAKNLISLRQGGSPEELPIQWEKKTDKVINRLINERLKQARKLYQQNDTPLYEAFAKGICSDIRILVERMIELDLFCDVVVRFRAAINTQGKLHKVSVTKRDTELVDSFMSKYSVYEHSNSPETPVSLPDPDELEADLKILQAWREELEARRTSA